MQSNLSTIETSRLTECESTIRKGLSTFIDVGNALTEIRDDKLYRIEYVTFEEYCSDAWGMKRAQAYRLIESSKVVKNLSPIGDILPPKTESIARELASLEPEQQQEVWKEVAEIHGDSPTAKQVRDVRESTGSFHVSSGENDWYTPQDMIESARKVMGSIDLDPASSVLAQESIKAQFYFTKDASGLDVDWAGNVWMNPPYSMPEIEIFIDKLLSENVNQWIVLTNNSSDTGWFHKLLEKADQVCFTKGRVRFTNPSSETMATRQGQTFFYHGDHHLEFAEEFKRYGAIMEVIHDHTA